MDPIPVKDVEADQLWRLQKAVQLARLEGRYEDVRRIEAELREKIYELYPQTRGHNVRYDVSSRRIFVWAA